MNQATALKKLNAHLKDWTSSCHGRRDFLASMGVLLSSCANAPKTRYREGDNSGQEILLNPLEEQHLTEEVLPQMRKDYPPMNDPEVQSYLTNLGQKIVSTSNLANHPYQYNFTAVNVNSVNAFALPAGTIFVTVPLIAMAETEAELAGVVGHEIGHVLARHAAERITKAKREQGNTFLYAIGGALGGAALGYGVGRLICPSKDEACVRKASELGSYAGVLSGILIQKYAFMANSREDELEADRIGFKTALAAGYDKDHIGTFYSRLLKMEQNNQGTQSPLLANISDALSTHPPSQERVKQMTELAGHSENKPKSLVSSREFDQIKNICLKNKRSINEKEKS